AVAGSSRTLFSLTSRPDSTLPSGTNLKRAVHPEGGDGMTTFRFGWALVVAAMSLLLAPTAERALTFSSSRRGQQPVRAGQRGCPPAGRAGVSPGVRRRADSLCRVAGEIELQVAVTAPASRPGVSPARSGA